MSNNIPFEIQEVVIKSVLPVKSLIRFRSVSKQWKSLIDSPEFITHHGLNPAKPNNLLVRYTDKYVSIADDDSFPHHQFSPVLPTTVMLLRLLSMLDCSHGLVCLHGYTDTRKLAKTKRVIVVWNPSIRKSFRIVLPRILTGVGFGVCPKTGDPKIVKITRVDSWLKSGWKAEVYTLSSRGWRKIPMNLRWHSESVKFSRNQVVVNGVIHWLANKWRTGSRDMIISFDLTSEEFGVVDLPNSLQNLNIFKRKGSLAVLDYNENTLVCDVWKMIKNGDPKSWFTKLFTVSFKRTHGTISYRIMGFRKNGELIAEHVCGRHGVVKRTLEVYKPCSEHINYRETDVAYNSIFTMASYTESLLLLNHVP